MSQKDNKQEFEKTSFNKDDKIKITQQKKIERLQKNLKSNIRRRKEMKNDEK